jgi:hypothetical protein
MTIHQGDAFQQNFTLTSKTTRAPVGDITGWTFEAQFRVELGDEVALATLTSENGGFAVIDGPNARLQMIVTAEQTATFPVGKVVFDVLRTDVVPGPVWYFGGHAKVKRPVTRP